MKPVLEIKSPAQPRQQAQSARLASLPWLTIVWFGALAILCYAPVLERLIRQWDTDPNMSHGFFVPLVAGYIVWQQRERLLQIKPQPSWLGLLVLAGAAFQLHIATLGAELFLARTAFVETIIGIVLFLGGFPLLRALAFPLLLLFFMVPLPAVVFNQITFPLQLLASRLAETFLMLIGIPVLRDGNILELASQRLSVVEACSGIRSLLSLTFLSLVYSYFFERSMWVRVLLLLATVPIAILANASRVAITGILGEYDHRLAEGFFHGLSGWVIFMVAFAGLILTHRLLILAKKLLQKPGASA